MGKACVRVSCNFVIFILDLKNSDKLLILQSYINLVYAYVAICEFLRKGPKMIKNDHCFLIKNNDYKNEDKI